MSVNLFHMSKSLGGHGSEYIRPKNGVIDITSHGLGSGIYCVTKDKMDQIMTDRTRDSIHNDPIVEVTMIHPLHIRTVNEAALLVNFSKTIGHLLEHKLKKKRDIISEWQKVSNQDRVKMHQFLNLVSAQSTITEEMKQTNMRNLFTSFAREYTERTDFVKMPITLFLEKMGFGGVYCHPESGFDNFSKGSVVFIPYVTDAHEDVIVNIYKINMGASATYKYELPDYKYNFDKKMYEYYVEPPLQISGLQRPKLKLLPKMNMKKTL